MEFTEANYQLNAVGKRCPEPVMLIRGIVRKMLDGETLAIVADDPSTARDIPSFCRFMDHTLIKVQTTTMPYQYLLRKGL
ncbi:MAG: tRNA 2-thiouridine synthesizing protein A [Alteromonadaceae bacterium]